MRTCISPEGRFRYGIHKPSYAVRNLRRRADISRLGCDADGSPVDNRINFPDRDIEVAEADWIYEIANPFPFRGSTFIGKGWADRAAAHPERIALPPAAVVSFSRLLADREIAPDFINSLPRPLLLSLATTSTDPDDLIRLARLSCRFTSDGDGRPLGLRFHPTADGTVRADIDDHDLFEAVANNPALPDPYKIAMVIRPGAQGGSEIVGDFDSSGTTHVYEYLRRNSYIGGGHYAANMAEDAIRYTIASLGREDMRGLRHLYYQRTFVRLADLLGVPIPTGPLESAHLEELRRRIVGHPGLPEIEAAATLWGWNFGFDYASSGYRLHASHQQIHQQYALIPAGIEGYRDGFSAPTGRHEPFVCGDMISEAITAYRHRFDRELFRDYLTALATNRRMDGRSDREQSLVVWQDERVILFVPKAQTSQWELQLMTTPDKDGRWVGTIVEADDATRNSLDTGLLKAQQALAGRGARLVTSIEYSKRFTSPEICQPLIYSLLPKLPESPGAFSESQLRFINGHYPEDFAAVCRQSLAGRKS